MEASEIAIKHLKQSDNRLKIFLIVVTLVVAAIGTYKIIDLSNYVKRLVNESAGAVQVRDKQNREFLVCFFSVGLDQRTEALLRKCEKEVGV